MKTALPRTWQGALDSSAIVRIGVPVIDGSVVCRGVGAVARWAGRVRARIITGLGGDWSVQRERRSEQRVEALVGGSRIVAAAGVWLAAAAAAARVSAPRRLVDTMLALDMSMRVRLVGVAAATAAVTQTLVLSAAGMPVQRVGWILRGCVLAAGLVMTWRPQTFGLAWRDWRERSRPPSRA